MKFFYYFLGSLLFSFLVWIVVVMGEFGRPTKMSQWIWDAYNKKQSIAKGINGKKIVVVAGSNALFGVDSKIVSKAFRLPVLNYGVNAGIELPLTLYLAKKVIKRGDIVLMPLEYPMYNYDGSAGVQMIDYLLTREPDLFWRLSLYEQFYIVWHIALKRVWRGYFDRSKKPVTKGLYGVHHIDENGDQIDIDIKHRENWMYAEVLSHVKKPERYGHNFDRNSLGWKYLSRFVKWCKKRDVRVIFMPSTLMRDKSYFNDPVERWFYKNLAKEVRKRGWEFVGEPYEYMYDKKEYFNTNFHLIDSARKKRTLRMVEELKTLPLFVSP